MLNNLKEYSHPKNICEIMSKSGQQFWVLEMSFEANVDDIQYCTYKQMDERRSRACSVEQIIDRTNKVHLKELTRH